MIKINKIGAIMFPIFFTLWLLPNMSIGQKNTAGAGLYEFGLGLGGINYTGELTDGYSMSNYRPGAMIFFRYNISPVVSFRGSLMGGNIGANDKNVPDPINQARLSKFSSALYEVGLSFEYNFLNYRPKKEIYRFTPYFTSGFCIFGTKNTETLAAGIPMGIGFKYRLSQRLNLGIELVARKTFTDRLDGVDSNYIGIHQTANTHDTDWYYYTGITISWTSFSIECPTIYMKQ